MITKNILSKILFLLFISVGMAGCSPYYQKFPVVKRDTYCANQQISILRQKGVIVKRDPFSAMMTIDIPTSSLFLPHSANFNDSAFKLLDNVVNILNCYEEEDVRVTGNIVENDNFGCDLMQALAEKQAHEVHKYLWSQDINASLIYTEGRFSSQNYIEIKFKKYWRDVDVHYGVQ